MTLKLKLKSNYLGSGYGRLERPVKYVYKRIGRDFGLSVKSLIFYCVNLISCLWH